MCFLWCDNGTNSAALQPSCVNVPLEMKHWKSHHGPEKLCSPSHRPWWVNDSQHSQAIFRAILFIKWQLHFDINTSTTFLPACKNGHIPVYKGMSYTVPQKVIQYACIDKILSLTNAERALPYVWAWLFYTMWTLHLSLCTGITAVKRKKKGSDD